MLTQDGERFLVSGKTSHGIAEATQTWMVVEVDNLQPDTNNRFKSPAYYTEIPVHMSSQVKRILGVLPGSRLIFLDHDFWVCSYALESIDHDDIGPMACQRLYSMPRDWMGSGSLESRVLVKDGILFWPGNDGVVAIECCSDDTRLWYPD